MEKIYADKTCFSKAKRFNLKSQILVMCELLNKKQATWANAPI